MSYVQGFLTPVPTARRQAFVDHAAGAVPLFKAFGATRQVEAWGDDVPAGTVNDLHGAVRRQPDETVVFSWLEYPDRATYDAANARMMSDPRMAEMPPMPFDGTRMMFGGFRPLIDVGPRGPAGYVDGFVLPVQAHREADYAALAQAVAPVFLDHGAIRYVEAWADDVPHGEITDFYRAAHAGEDETVAFAWCEWPDRTTRDRGQRAIMADPRMQTPPDDLPFDGRRMMFGGFVPVVDR